MTFTLNLMLPLFATESLQCDQNENISRICFLCRIKSVEKISILPQSRSLLNILYNFFPKKFLLLGYYKKLCLLRIKKKSVIITFSLIFQLQNLSQQSNIQAKDHKERVTTELQLNHNHLIFLFCITSICHSNFQ